MVQAGTQEFQSHCQYPKSPVLYTGFDSHNLVGALDIPIIKILLLVIYPIDNSNQLNQPSISSISTTVEDLCNFNSTLAIFDKDENQ